MKYSEVNDFMGDFLEPWGAVDFDGLMDSLNETMKVNTDKITPTSPTHYIADELIYRSMRNRAEFLQTDYPSKNQLVKWFKEKELYDSVLELVEGYRHKN